MAEQLNILSDMVAAQLPSMSKTNSIGVDFVIAGAPFTFSFYWLPNKALMTMRIANDAGSIYYGYASLDDPLTLRGCIPGARTNTDIIVAITTNSGLPLTPTNADKFVLVYAVGRFV